MLLEVPGVGNITVDVAYGGCFYVLVDATELGVRLTRRVPATWSSGPSW